MSPLNPKRVLFHLLQLTLLSFGLWLTATQVFAQNWSAVSQDISTSLTGDDLQTFAYKTLNENPDVEALRKKLSTIPAACVSVKKAWIKGITEALSGKTPSKSIRALTSEKPCNEFRVTSGQNPKQVELACCLVSHSMVGDSYSKITRELPSSDENKALVACKEDQRNGAEYATELCADEAKPPKLFSVDGDDMPETCTLILPPDVKNYANCFMSGFIQNAKSNESCRETLRKAGLIEGEPSPSTASAEASSAGQSPSSFKSASGDSASPLSSDREGMVGK